MTRTTRTTTTAHDPRRPRLAPRLVAALTVALVLPLAGCRGDDPAGPEPSEPPVLPAPERLTFDLDFFEQRGKALAEIDPSGQATPGADAAAGTKLNFVNAVVRVAVIKVVGDLVLAPPIAAFSLALLTVPSPQGDGSYLWVYTYVDGDEEAQVRLRGTPQGDRVLWELRVSSTDEEPPLENVLWFEGETWRQGQAGFWRFHDFHLEGEPVVARIDWDVSHEGRQLVFTNLDDNPGDTMSFRTSGPRCGIEYFDASEGMTWFIRWNVEVGNGSLRAPDYNGGEEACWDEDQNDVECPPAA